MIKIYLKKILTFTTVLSVLLSSFLPAFSNGLIYAQEVSPIPTVTEVIPTPAEVPAEPDPTVIVAPEVQITPTLIPTPTQAQVEPTPIINGTDTEPTPTSTPTPTTTPAPSIDVSPTEITPSATPAPTPVSVWQIINVAESVSYETVNNVVVGETYSAPQNDRVKVKFTKLPDQAGKLVIKEVRLTAEQVKQTGALSDIAYDITSTMTDGTFTYDLTLPLPKEAQNKEVDVKSSETTDQIGSAQKVNEPEEKTADTITIKGLNHFTVFILTSPNPDTIQRVLINEIAPTAGTEWVELYNNGTASVNLAAGTGWVIRNSAGNSQSLSALGTITPAGRAIFEAPSAWLSDVAPETIMILNELGTTVDTVTVALTAPGIAVEHYPLATESVGRKTDGIADWTIFTTPSKGTANTMPVPTTGLAEVGPTNTTTTFPKWYKDTNGLALDLMEAADTNGISDPVDSANSFSTQIGFNAEGFWFSADASMPTDAGSADLVQAVEASFAPNDFATDGLQSAFARIRIRIDVTDPGTYTVTYPYGQKTYVVDTPGNRAINDTIDIGCFGRVSCDSITTPNYSTVLTGEIGPFLTWDTFNIDPALSDPALTIAGRRYVGIVTQDHAVKGSPTGNNFFRVQGPNIGGPGVNSIQTNLFTVTGRLADASAPVITLFGANPVNVNQGTVYTDAGATATDDLGGNLTGSIQITGLPLDTATFGAKTVTYSVTDSAGRTTVATRTVNVVESPAVDNTAPVITLLGSSPTNVVKGTPYIDAGATALDNVDGDITGSIVTVNPVNSNTIGTYTVTYNVSDTAGNRAIEATRTVNVVADTIAPIITITGSNPISVLTGATYTDAGATATDNVDGNLTASIITTGLPINTVVPGTFTVTYTVTDTAGNSTAVTRTVNVVNTITGSLAEVSTINPNNGYPTWYKDSAGIALQLCLGLASGLADPNCVLPVAAPLEPNYDPTQPIVFPTNFPGESFWYIADTDVAPAGQAGGGRVRLRYALEAAFTTETPAANEQIAFLRANLGRIEDLVPGSDYTVTHPFGQFTIHAGDALLADGVTPNPDAGVADDGGFFRLEDGAFAAPLTDVSAASFLSAATTHISKFLKQTNPLPPAGYIGDGVTLSTIESGPMGNFVRIEGPSIDSGNYDSDGNPNVLTINRWTVAGKLADITPPVITLTGTSPVNVTQGATYTDAGATATDDFDGNVTASIVTTGLPINTAIVGAKTVTYTVTDRAGNSSSATRTVNVTGSDTTAPVITVLGSNPVSVTVGSVYTDAGATASDNVDGDITANITTAGLPINTSAVGSFTITYAVSDASLNNATATRTVNVVDAPAPDTTAPIITLLGTTPIDIILDTPFTDAGATATDNVDGDITANIITTNLVNTSVVGTYTVTYNVSDAAGNAAAPVIRTVNVVAPIIDLTPPLITLLGTNPVDITVGSTYTDAGATASDNVDGNITGSILTTGLPINTSAVGTFTVTYTVSDASFNIATATRTVNVVEAPVTTGSITVVKDAIPNDVQDFAFRLRNGAFDERFSLDDDGNNLNDLTSTRIFSDIAAGTYTLQEDGVNNWLTAINCNDPDNGTTIDTSSRTATIDLDAGENITCTYTNSKILSVLGQGQFISTSGNNGATLSIISQGTSTLTVDGNGGTSSVTVPDGTTISRIDGETFDLTQLLSSVPAPESITGLTAGTVAAGALQWGITNVGLIFSQPITLSIFIGNTFNGQLLNVLRSVTGTSDWTSDGIVAPATCTVTGGFCTFQATKASTYIASSSEEEEEEEEDSTPTPTPTPTVTPTPTPTTSDPTSTPTQTSNNSSNNNSSGGGADNNSSAPVCNDVKPGSAPVLSVVSNGENEVTLSWTKALDPVTYYLLAFGFSVDNLQFGNPNIGGKDTTTYTVKGLSGNTTYYFKVRAGNGCMPGDYSNILPVTVTGNTISTNNNIPEGFDEGILGVDTEDEGEDQADVQAADIFTGPEVDELPKDKSRILSVLQDTFTSVPVIIFILLIFSILGVKIYLRKTSKT